MNKAQDKLSSPVAVAAIAAAGVFALLFYFMSTSPALPDEKTNEVRLLPDAAVPCQNVIISEKDGEIFYTCPHPPDYNPDSPIVFDLPSPTYKMVECTGTYGCSHRYLYNEITPADLLTEEQRQQVINKVMNLPEVQMNDGWILDQFIVQPYEGHKWGANVQLFLDGIRRLNGECGWYGQVSIDLETLNVIGIGNIPPQSTGMC